MDDSSLSLLRLLLRKRRADDDDDGGSDGEGSKYEVIIPTDEDLVIEGAEPDSTSTEK